MKKCTKVRLTLPRRARRCYFLHFMTTSRFCFCAASFDSAAGAHARNNVVSLLDCVRKDDRTSLIFEFVEGRDFVKDLPTFSEMHVARYMRELFIALAHVHR